jgi:hypothetical protein
LDYDFDMLNEYWLYGDLSPESRQKRGRIFEESLRAII